MKKNQGFTLIETLIAIFLLTLTVGGLLTLTAGGFFSVRYSRNQIVANNLLQESLEYIRNTRDTGVQQGETWGQWLSTFNVDQNGAVVSGANTQGCFSSSGCIVDPYTSSLHIKQCPSQGCQTMLIQFWPNPAPSFGFYGYTGGSYPLAAVATTPFATSYWRVITMQQASYDTNQVTITATVHWLNGNAPKSTTQSILITSWEN